MDVGRRVDVDVGKEVGVTVGIGVTVGVDVGVGVGLGLGIRSLVGLQTDKVKTRVVRDRRRFIDVLQIIVSAGWALGRSMCEVSIPH